MKKIKKAFLIYPPTGMYMRDDRCQAPVKGMTAQPMRTPLDLAYMAASLEREGIECKIKDYPSEDARWLTLKEDLQHFNPDMLIISITTPTMYQDLKACSIARKLNKDVLVVSKGAHYLTKDEKVFEEFKDLDIIIRGESELTVADIATAGDLENVPGISFIKNGKIIKTPDRPFLDDLDKLPFPARHLLNNDLYLTPDTKEPITLIYSGRGCPYQCIFCAVPPVSGHQIKLRSPENIVDEIEECVKKYGIRDFFFRADTFTFDEKWVIEICKRIIDKGLKIRWGTNSRVDTISENRLKWMKEAGCWVIGFGIESGNQESLDLMKKRAGLDDARKAVSLCRKHDIKTYTLFIIGLPWETRKSVKDTIRFAKELDGDYMDINIAYPLPGTELFDMAKEEELFNEKEVHGYDYSKPLIRTRHLTTEELIDIRRLARLGFYLRPRYVLRTLLSIRSPKVLLNYMRAGLALLGDFFSRNPNVTDFREEI
ncbi:MAG: B12-binding domain-containing radical SAM protein [Candidatus Omnitrophota bacterium]